MKKKQSNRVSSLFKKLDFYPEDISFRESGDESFKSVFGACISLLIVFMVLIYATSKAQILFLKEDTKYSEYEKENALEDKDYYYNETEFFFSFALGN